MARKPIKKELVNSTILKEYASWIYCSECKKTVAYLCYVTYDLFEFSYTCGCGNCGCVLIEFAHGDFVKSGEPLALLKNRLCCPTDLSPLFSVVEKNLVDFRFRVLCNSCHRSFFGEKGCLCDGEEDV